jgi:hypothetical protein
MHGASHKGQPGLIDVLTAPVTVAQQAKPRSDCTQIRAETSGSVNYRRKTPGILPPVQT